MNSGEKFTFTIKEQIGIIATYSTGWKKEVNMVEWNGNNGKVDIRDWSPGHETMSRGITLHEVEAKKLLEALGEYFEKHKE